MHRVQLTKFRGVTFSVFQQKNLVFHPLELSFDRFGNNPEVYGHLPPLLTSPLYTLHANRTDR